MVIRRKLRFRGVKYESMSFKARSWVMALTAILGAGAYWGARHYSPALIWYVVEETLIRKAPEGISPDQTRLRLRVYLASLPDGRTRVERLLTVSQRLEKIQKLELPEFERLLEPEGKMPLEPGK